METKLFEHFSAMGKLNNLHAIDVEKFKYACKKAVLENPSLGFEDLCMACNIYLNLIKEFPQIDLGDIKLPTE